MAEPGALIGFAGPRVIKQTMRQKLPKGFQRAEFLFEKGFVDQVVQRSEQKEMLAKLLSLHSTITGRRKSQMAAAEATAFERVQAARAKRPAHRNWTLLITSLTDFVELHGDRRFGDDPAVVCGIARLGGRPVTVIA